jgi:hypothetical protein
MPYEITTFDLFFVGLALAYVALDLVLGIVLGHCVLPGLKCRACRRGKEPEKS